MNPVSKVLIIAGIILVAADKPPRYRMVKTGRSNPAEAGPYKITEDLRN